MSLVLEAGNFKKIKITLDDYPHAQDVSLRVKLHQASFVDIKVLEELLFSSIKTTHEKLQDALDTSPEDLKKSLDFWKDTNLFKEESDHLVIDKELRKFFELEIQRFEEDFDPGIDFLAQLFKKVPIHILPAWYALPRTSTNIFESILEKYLQTPQIYQRLLSETQTHEPHLKAIINLLYTSDDLELDLNYIKQRLTLSDASLFELVSSLEFHLIACASYKLIDGQYKGVLTPFAEFKAYLNHLRSTEAKTINDQDVQKITLSPFAFVEGLSTLLKCFKSKTYSFPLDRHQEAELKEALAEDDLAYLEFEELMQKLLQIQLIDGKNSQINLNETSHSFMAMKQESAALTMYRHPFNRPKYQLQIPIDKAIREAEKAAIRLLGKDWVLLDDFMKGLITPLSDEQQVILKKVGRKWQYHLPQYTQTELDFVKHMFTDWFEKVAVVEMGFYLNKPCIRLTALGTEIFS